MPVGVAAGRVRAAAAQWLAGSAGRLAGLDSAAEPDGDGGARFAVCFMC